MACDKCKKDNIIHFHGKNDHGKDGLCGDCMRGNLVCSACLKLFVARESHGHAGKVYCRRCGERMGISPVRK